MSDFPLQEEAAPRRTGKSEAAFRTISEVSDELDVPQHVLRFWEGKFPQIKPLKRGGGRRYYRPEDVLLLGRIRDLLYKDGYTIKGVQKLLKDLGPKGLAAESAKPMPALVAEAPTPVRETAAPVAIAPRQDERKNKVLREVLHDLIEMREQLRRVAARSLEKVAG